MRRVSVIRLERGIRWGNAQTAIEPTIQTTSEDALGAASAVEYDAAVRGRNDDRAAERAARKKDILECK